MLTPIQVEYNLQSAEYYFATLMDQLVDETMQLEPVDSAFTEQVNQLFYTIEAVRFLVDRGIFTDNPTCLAVYNLMMIQIGINTSLPNLVEDTTLIIPGIILPIPFQGPQGPAGPQGVQGVQGPVGQQGPQGSQGPIGNQGVQGPQGSIGSQGLQGTIGPQGPQGLQGTQGNQGFQGVQGPNGTQGFQGDQGPQGSQGFQGNQGNQGPTGPQGFQGTQGDQGNQGFQGPTGPQGFQGFQGPDGPQGFQGVQGPIGPQGFQGTQGFQGFQGPQGTQGPGVSGTTNNVAKFTSSTAIGDSQIRDDGTNVAIGVAPASYKFRVNGDIAVATTNRLQLDATAGTVSLKASATAGSMQLYTGGTADSNIRVQISNDGAVAIYNVFNRRTASYTLVITDAGRIIEMNVGSANNLTVPLNSSVAFTIGTEIQVLQYGAGQTTIVATSGVTLRSKSGQLKIGNQYTGVTLVKVGTDEWYVIGNVAA